MEASLWNAHLAGQLARILLRYNKGRNALDNLNIANKFIELINSSSSSSSLKHNHHLDVNILLNGINGFKGLIFRTMFDYSNSELYLSDGIKLVGNIPLSIEINNKLNLLGSNKLRWWSREDVREMYINYGDLLARKSQNKEAYNMYNTLNHPSIHIKNTTPPSLFPPFSLIYAHIYISVNISKIYARLCKRSLFASSPKTCH